MSWRPCLLLLLSLTGTPAAIAGPATGSSFEQSLFAPPMDRLYDNRIVAESAGYLSVNLFDVSIDPAKATDASLFTITSTDDPDYAASKNVHAAKSGSRTRTIRVAIRKPMLVKGTAIFLQAPTPLKNGKTYSVVVGDIGAAVPKLEPVTFDDRRQVNDNLRVNQLGYLPDYEKYAYLGQYMGDLGPMPFGVQQFELLDANGKSVFTGPLTRRSANEELVGQQLFQADFTAFKTPGMYRVFIPGVGVSYAFQIGDGALNPAYTNLMRGHYHQRCGSAVDAEYSRHAREACHLDDAFLEQRAEKTNFVAPKNPPLYPTNYDDQRHPAIHGHHDAGDYGKYTITGGAYVFASLNAMTAFPDKFRDDNTGLPYSGNGIPDLLEEVKWELDWLENMQDTDGGVFGVIKPNNGGYEHSMPMKESHRLFYPKDTVFTASYAAALALASRSPDMRKHYPEQCDAYLAKAKKSWEWLEKNERYTQYFHYGAEFGDWDERCWAAAELYAATGEAKYHDYFLKNFEPERKRWGWWGLFDSVGHAVTTYIFVKDQPTDAAMLARCKAALREACQMHVNDGQAFPYRFSMPKPSIDFKNYGWYFPGDLAGYNLLMGYAVEKDAKYLQCAFDNLSYEYGANAFGYFLQTGLGSKRNIEVVSDYANSDEIIEPIPGIPLGIGSAGFYYLSQYDKKLNEGTYPQDSWPLMNRWYDGFNVTTEFTMGPMMRETITAAFFADLGKTKTARPTVKIKANTLAGPAPLKVQFSIETNLPAGKVRQVFWDFGDETFSIQSSPEHQFTGAGHQYPVAVSIVDEHGAFAYATATVNCALANPEFSQEPRKADAKTLVLFHLDGDLKDASKHGLELTVKTKKVSDRTPFKFNNQPPMWMATPTGSCLVLDGNEHFTVAIPQRLIPDPATTPLTMEMMLYVKAFAGWGYDGNPFLLGAATDWDSSLGWQQETWDKVSAPKFGPTSSAVFAKDFPRDQWCHVVIHYDGKGKSEMTVNGKSWGTIDGQPFKANLKKNLMVAFGPFRGMIDEVCVSTGN